MRRLPAAVFSVALVLLSMPRPAQPASRGQAATGRILLATVVDGAGKSQVDFGVDDFVVREDGDRREVLDVHVADYPLVVLIDDGVQPAQLETMKASVARFMTRIGERPTACGTLSNPEGLVASLEDSREDVLSRLTKISTSTAPPSTLPAVAHAARLLHETGAPFSAIVIVTGRAIDARVPVQGELLPSIVESGASIHVVETRTPTSSTDADNDVPDLLRVLAEQTHGQYTRIFSAVSYATALDRLADKLSAELMIQYLVPPDGTGGDVQVGVRRPGSRVVGLGVK